MWELDEALCKRVDGAGKEAAGPEIGPAENVLARVWTGLWNVFGICYWRVLITGKCQQASHLSNGANRNSVSTYIVLQSADGGLEDLGDIILLEQLANVDLCPRYGLFQGRLLSLHGC